MMNVKGDFELENGRALSYYGAAAEGVITSARGAINLQTSSLICVNEAAGEFAVCSRLIMRGANLTYRRRRRRRPPAV
jgi:hypothetical protein